MPYLRARSFALVLATVFLSTLAACGGDDPTGPGVLGSGPVSAKVDDASWTAVLAFATNTGGIVAVGASSTSGEAMGFGFQGTTTGTYIFSDSTAHNANYTSGTNSWTAGGGTGSGSIVVNALDATHVAGTFSFEAVTYTGGSPTTVSITEGVFDVAF